MRLISKLSVLAVLTATDWFALPSAQADVIYTDRVAFESALPPGFYFNDFSGLATSIGPEVLISQFGGTPIVSFSANAAGGMGIFDVPGEPFKSLGNWFPLNDINVQFNSFNVNAAGGNLWLTDVNGDRIAGTINVAYSNGTNGVVNSTTSGPLGYFGITSANFFSSVAFSTGANDVFVNFSNFSVASVPEPASLLLVGLGTCGLLLRRRGLNS
jgi:hypothetical protein